MKIWLDDWRDEPSGWVWAKTVKEMMLYLDRCEVSEVSLDYDLGDFETNGLGAIIRMRENFEENGKLPPPIIHIHSQHPNGKIEMEIELKKLKTIVNKKVSNYYE